MHNNLVQTPVRANQINAVVQKINRGICRPITHTYYIEGCMSIKISGSVYCVGYIPLPCKLNPTVVYEIATVGSMPNDDNVLYDWGNNPIMMIKRTISPFCILHGVASVPDGSNDSNGYSSVNCNPEMEIATGATLIEKPIFSEECIAAVNALSVGDPWHLDVGYIPTSSIDRAMPSAANYKQNYTAPVTYGMPSFVLNVTVYYEEGIKI